VTDRADPLATWLGGLLFWLTVVKGTKQRHQQGRGSFGVMVRGTSRRGHQLSIWPRKRARLVGSRHGFIARTMVGWTSNGSWLASVNYG
jgi:hypothetical protein